MAIPNAYRESNGLQNWIAQLDRRMYACLIGGVIGVTGVLIGVLFAFAGAIVATGILLGTLAALYVITDLRAALYAIVFTIVLLPFGTFPFRIAFTPTLLDAAMGAFVAVYLLQFVMNRRKGLRFTYVHGFVLLYMSWLILSFLLGMQYARPTSANLRQFAETLLSISMVLIIGDVLRDKAALRRFVTVLLLAIGVQAIVAIAVYALPDQTAERTLIRLSRIGYPDGGVIRYIEDNPALDERAIGTWVDPNALGGLLAIGAVMIAPQLFSRVPLANRRWIWYVVFACVGLGLFLTYSRASLLGFAIGLACISLFKGYRKYLIILFTGAVLFFVLPQTQNYVVRLLQAFTGSDLATQMRLGEYGDSLELISQYPITGVGFTGSPEIDLYTDVASMYLIMANQIGLVGVFLFALVIVSVFAYAFGSWRFVRDDPAIYAVFIGCHAALFAALFNATADMYFFRLDFQSSITLFWLLITLCVATSRIARESGAQITVDPPQAFM
jgi:polysaccharide biosynthesis protein PslJ